MRKWISKWNNWRRRRREKKCQTLLDQFIRLQRKRSDKWLEYCEHHLQKSKNRDGGVYQPGRIERDILALAVVFASQRHSMASAQMVAHWFRLLVNRELK